MKQSRGQMAGAGCYLGNREHDTVMVAESVMSALSAWQIRLIPCCPVAGMGAAMLSFLPPRTATNIIIAADNDEAGIRAANRLWRRMRKLGKTVTVIKPSVHGADFNDWLRIMGERNGD